MLVNLAPRHAEMLERFLREFDPVRSELHGYFCERTWPIERVIAAHAAESRGENLPDGWVPCTTWFWEEGDALRGVINVRHALTPALREVGGHIGYSVAPSHRRSRVATRMLAAVLPRCRALGMECVLLTCDADNLGSICTIEANGGLLQRDMEPGDGGRRELRGKTLTF